MCPFCSPLHLWDAARHRKSAHANEIIWCKWTVAEKLPFDCLFFVNNTTTTTTTDDEKKRNIRGDVRAINFLKSHFNCKRLLLVKVYCMQIYSAEMSFSFNWWCGGGKGVQRPLLTIDMGKWFLIEVLWRHGLHFDVKSCSLECFYEKSHYTPSFS